MMSFADYKILIVGSSGLLGLAWSNHFARSGHKDIVLASSKSRFIKSPYASIDYNFRDLGTLVKSIQEIKPDLIINCSALANVELCESNKALAYRLNVELPSIIASACRMASSLMVHISTDHFYDGKSARYVETDKTSPLNYYAETKLRGEEAILDCGLESLILRTNFYGWGGLGRLSFSDKIIRALSEGSRLSLFSDAYFSPVSFDRLFNAVEFLVKCCARGIFNISGDRLSKYEFGHLIADRFGFSHDLIDSSSLESRSDLIPRGLDLSLSSSKLQLSGFCNTPIEEEIDMMFRARAEIINGYKCFGVEPPEA